jgi:ABC-type transport system substrate-binding protein
MNTFIDPDRYELFHSSQISHPGLNLSSYVSEEKTVTVVQTEDGNDSVNVPEVDFRLEEGRALNNSNEDLRAVEYGYFQRIIAEEVPVVFLYHPKLNYVHNKRIQNVNLDGVNSLEERFENIDEWEIRLDASL